MSTGPALFNDPALERRIGDQGFATLRFFAPAQVDALAARFARMVARFGIGTPPPALRNEMSYMRPNPALRAAAHRFSRASIVPHLEALASGYRLLSAGFFVKHGHSTPFTPHREWTQTEDPSQRMLNVWLALDDVAERNGGLFVVPGSHRLWPGIHPLGEPVFFAGFMDTVLDWLVPVPLARGEALIFDTRLIHGSPTNQTSAPRRALHAVFIPEASRLVFYRPLESIGPSRRFERIDMTGLDNLTLSTDELLHADFDAPRLGTVEEHGAVMAAGDFESELRNLGFERPARERGAMRPLFGDVGTLAAAAIY